jgi:hypothetical protein
LLGALSLVTLLAWSAPQALANHQPTHHEWFGFYHLEIGKPGQPGPPADGQPQQGLSGTATIFVPEDGYAYLSTALKVDLAGEGLCYVPERRLSGNYFLPLNAEGDDTHDASSSPIALDVTGRDDAGPGTGYSIKTRKYDLFSSETRSNYYNDNYYRPPGCPPDANLPNNTTTTGKAPANFGGVVIPTSAEGSPNPNHLCGERSPQLECQSAPNVTVTVETARGPVSATAIATWDFIRNSASGGDAEVQEATRLYGLAARFGGETLGFYSQILNLACAARRSAAPQCLKMAKHYADHEWAGTWTYDVFNGFLKEYGGTINRDAVKDLEARAGRWSSTVRLGCLLVFAERRCQLIQKKDLDTLFAGALHFAMLQDEYKKATRRAIADALHSGQEELPALQAAIFDIRRQHEALFCYGVVPGFREVGGNAEISNPAERVAIQAVPYVAAVLRERAIRQVLIERFGKAKADRLLKDIGEAPPTGCPA